MKLILSFFISIICSCCLAQATEKRTTVAKINTSPPTVKKEEPGTLGFIFGLDTKNPDTIAVKILYVFAGSAADEAELGAGTLIDAINGHQLVNETVQDIAKLLSGNIGTQVVLSVRKGLFSSKTDITLTRKKTPQYPVLENYKKAVVAYQQYDYASAVQLFKKAGDYPDARLMLALIYGGISPIPDTKNPEFYKKREQLRSFTNIDSAKTYMNQLLIEGYPGASYAMYYNCLVMNGSAFYKNYARYDTYNHRGISNYWLYESAANDHLPAQEELINKITSDKNDEGFSHDKNEAMYWYKRAMAAGYQKGNELLAKINKMPAKDYHFIHFEDVQKMTQIAHLYKEDKFNYKGVSDLCPFGIRGCRSGYYSDYGFDDAFKLDWYTYYIADHNDAVQIFDAAAKDMKSYFSGAEWYTINEYMHSKPEKSLLAKFSVTETDGKKYNMQLGMILQQNNQGYYIVFIYEEAP